MLAYYLCVFVLLATVLSTFRIDQPRFKLGPNSPWAISTDKILHTNEMLTCMNDLTRLTNAHEQSHRNTLKPTWQDFSALNFDICGFKSVIIVVHNTKFKLVSFYTLIFIYERRQAWDHCQPNTFRRTSW